MTTGLAFSILALTLAATSTTWAAARSGDSTGPGSGGDPWVEYDGAALCPNGAGAGKRVVLVSGDEEYRSEEALPQLGKILAVRHGFHCRVVFAIDPGSGEINPDVQTNIPGLEALDDADLMIIATRFRDLPDDQMAHIDRYLRAGKPVIGMRTATHAFDIKSSDTYKRYTWNYGGDEYKQGFGRQVLGETWVAHHGGHGHQSTRGVLVPHDKPHPIHRGLDDRNVWGPTDVYAVRLPMLDDVDPLVLGAVLDDMTPDGTPIEGEKNDPMMPVAWTRPYHVDDGPTGRAFATTMGAATDLSAEGTRRMLVNAAYWALGLEASIPANGTDVRLVGVYSPTDFGFRGFAPGRHPSDHALKEDGQ